MKVMSGADGETDTFDAALDIDRRCLLDSATGTLCRAIQEDV